jgi:anti-sigma factor RsiW
MKACDGNRVAIFLYLDDELAPPERMALESHLMLCPGCREAVAEERSFLNELRSKAPLRRAPDRLRARVEEIVGDRRKDTRLRAQ